MNKILVIGDSCEDVFVYGYCKRLSPEAPVPILLPEETKKSSGMAANVYNNIRALGSKCDIISNEKGPIKTRYIETESNQTLLRLDERDTISRISDEVIGSINYDDYDAIVISDYNKGFLWPEDIENISVNHSLVFLDSKKPLNKWCKYIDVIKINEKEYFSNINWLDDNYEGELIITLGSHGSRYNCEIFPIEEQHPVRDLTGAGDTYLAALVVEYLKTNDISKSIQFANKCAAWVVTQKGVTVVDLNKMK